MKKLPLLPVQTKKLTANAITHLAKLGQAMRQITGTEQPASTAKSRTDLLRIPTQMKTASATFVTTKSVTLTPMQILGQVMRPSTGELQAALTQVKRSTRRFMPMTTRTTSAMFVSHTYISSTPLQDTVTAVTPSLRKSILPIWQHLSMQLLQAQVRL